MNENQIDYDDSEKADQPINPKKIKKVEIFEVLEGSYADRVCVDLTKLLNKNEGLLVGNYSRGLFLINNETAPDDQEYDIEPRPFRVNAGAISSYVIVPGGKTKYLSELKTGDKVLAVSVDGTYREIEIARIKIETRPMTLIKGMSLFDKDIPIENDEDIEYFNKYRQIFRWYDPDSNEQILKINELNKYKKKHLTVKMEISSFIQTAETVRLIKAPEKKPISITNITSGTSVFAYINNPTLKGRHFGSIYEGFCLEI